MGNNSTVTSQITLIMKIMQIEKCSFNTAINIIDRLNEKGLLDVYFEMHKIELGDGM